MSDANVAETDMEQKYNSNMIILYCFFLFVNEKGTVTLIY